MKKQSIAVLRDLIFTGKLTQTEIEALKNDSRKGVQLLLKQYEQKQKQQEQLERNHIQLQSFETYLHHSGKNYIAGIDEAGRGPLAGPVVAAAVILPNNNQLIGLNDSKLLTEKKRNQFAARIKEEAISYGISVVNNAEIDRINVSEATKSAMLHSVRKLSVTPDHLLIDAVELSEREGIPCPANAIINGDERSISIAAASILAKVTRDAIMEELHTEAPAYDFRANKGYPTKQHLEMLRKHGASTYHRRSFAPVRNSIS